MGISLRPDGAHQSGSVGRGRQNVRIAKGFICRTSLKIFPIIARPDKAVNENFPGEIPQNRLRGRIDCCEVMGVGELTGEAAVWNRVMGTERNGAKGEGAGNIGPELLALLEQKQQMLLNYGQLAGRCAGELRRALGRMVLEERRQERQLAALFYLLSGQRPCLTAQTSTKERESLSEGLRRMIREEERCGGRLEALAARSSGETAQALGQLCLQERQHFHRLVGLLGKSL